MTDETQGQTEKGKPLAQVVIQRLCEHHEHDLVVKKLHLAESDPWMSALIAAQLMLFGWAVSDRRVAKRTEGNAENLSLVLAEIGCLACHYRDAYKLTIRVLRKGIDHAAQVGQSKATDPDWPIDEWVRKNA